MASNKNQKNFPLQPYVNRQASADIICQNMMRKELATIAYN